MNNFEIYRVDNGTHLCISRDHLKELNQVLLACRTDGDHYERLEAIARETQAWVDWIEEGN